MGVKKMLLSHSLEKNFKHIIPILVKEKTNDGRYCCLILYSCYIRFSQPQSMIALSADFLHSLILISIFDLDYKKSTTLMLHPNINFACPFTNIHKATRSMKMAETQVLYSLPEITLQSEQSVITLILN